MRIPSKDILGRRQTVNRGITDDEKVWHFRSAWNVAALNCTSARHQPVLDAYSAYIKDHARDLKRVNDRIDRKYRNEMGARRAGIIEREGKMTSVYNFFALPPARSDFCAAALDISNRALAAPPTDGVAFAMQNFTLLQQPFLTFFDEYDQYRRESARWDAKYGATYGASQPGWVAVQDAKARGVVIPTVGENPAATTTASTQTAGTVVDETTGAEVPVVPVQDGFISQPVVEPIPTEGEETPAPAPRGLR
ncbi:hypothetical protein KCG46_07075 [Erythrobacter sp. WH158]|uniref:Uncharacterized protein n=2 Tax=Erythrobacter crassostreae TaxID=2828328 RepID=A0A9X1F376_9SPHN|nr:hypothetical protein [Erythrobacter crassostrea]